MTSGMALADPKPMLMLRPFQKTALSALEKPGHVICVSPTGSGKSLIYEKAAAVPNRKTVLISPLVALARQQFEKLKSSGVPVKLSAGGIKQSPSPSESGVWILSPENLLTLSKLQFLKNWKPDLLVVDECHCLWEWGDQFRPAFLEIPAILRMPSVQRSLWLTATLPYPARMQLRNLLPQPCTEIGEFELPGNLSLFIHRVPLQNRLEWVLSWVQQQRSSGIIFVNTRGATERIARLIVASGRSAAPYHGGMSTEERQNIESLVAKESIEVVVATSAFGMGMHYPHLAFVALWHPSTSLLSLVQKIGRAGRNSLRSGVALVLWDYEDFHLLEWTVGDSERRRAELTELLDFLRDESRCRQQGLQKYFNQDAPTQNSCSKCDICLSIVP